MSSEFGRVAVLFGGRSAERKVSLWSGAGVLEALCSKGIDAIAFDPAERDLSELKPLGVERAFIALHGRFGEDGSLQGALELMRIPYTGSGVMASAIAMDKVMTKRLWIAQGLPTPKYELLHTQTELRTVPDRLGLPIFVKPPHEGSTIGVTKVEGYSDMQDAYALAARFDSEVLAEEFVDGFELTVPVLGEGAGASALPVIQIIAPGGNYDFENKYISSETQYLCPAPFSAQTLKEVSELAVQAYRCVGCSGWGRVDFMLRRADQKPFLLEINTSPGMTGHSLVPIAAKVAGLSYADLCVQILRGASLKISDIKT